MKGIRVTTHNYAIETRDKCSKTLRKSAVFALRGDVVNGGRNGVYRSTARPATNAAKETPAMRSELLTPTETAPLWLVEAPPLVLPVACAEPVWPEENVGLMPKRWEATVSDQRTCKTDHHDTYSMPSEAGSSCCRLSPSKHRTSVCSSKK